MAETLSYMTPPTKKVPWGLALLAAWLFPGLGHILIGEKARGLLVGSAVIIAFVGGLLLGGVNSAEAPTVLPLQTNGISVPGEIFGKVMNRPWFVPQIMCGPLTIGAATAAARVNASPRLAVYKSHIRMGDVGTLYCGVAGMMNLLAMVDAAGRAARRSQDAAAAAAGGHT